MCRSVCQSVGRSVPRLIFWRIASGFFITAPAQSHANDAIVYTGLSTAPALHITAPAQHPLLMPVTGLVKKEQVPAGTTDAPTCTFSNFWLFRLFRLIRLFNFFNF